MSKSLWDSVKSNYSNAYSYMLGGPGTWNGAMAAAENFGGYFSNIDAANSAAEGNARSAEEARLNRDLQKEFAQNGVRWRVEDAKKAGIHPLAALGASGASYSPVSSTFQSAPDPIASTMSSLGQNLSRSMMTTRTGPEKQMQQLQLENQQLQNDYLRSQIAMNNSAQLGPSMPSNGTVTKPAELTASAKGHPSQEAGKVNSLAWSQTETGLVPVPSKDTKERIEDNMIQEVGWALRNNLMPNLGGGEAPPKSLLPPGATGWKWSYRNQEYQPDYTRYPYDYRTDGKGG